MSKQQNLTEVITRARKAKLSDEDTIILYEIASHFFDCKTPMVSGYIDEWIDRVKSKQPEAYMDAATKAWFTLKQHNLMKEQT